jgi:hypothetical protein
MSGGLHSIQASPECQKKSSVITQKRQSLGLIPNKRKIGKLQAIPKSTQYAF